jgi:hypothetical protein
MSHYPAYTHEMMLKMPYVTFMALIEADIKLRQTVADDVKPLEIPPWPKKRS